MSRKGRPFQELLLAQLADPEVSKHYLNEALEESIDSFLVALKTVAQARQMAKVAREAGVQRETLYRSLSEQGNPTVDTLYSVLKAVGLKFRVMSDEAVEQTAPVPPVHTPTLVTTDGSVPVTNIGLGHFFTSGYTPLLNATSYFSDLAVVPSGPNIDPIVDMPAANGFYGGIYQNRESERLER